jgi:hypothetical protein
MTCTGRRDEGIVALRAPYERVTLFRPDEAGGAKKIDRAMHPNSVIGVLNMPFRSQQLKS